MNVRSPVAEWLVHRASTPRFLGSNPGLGKVDSPCHPFRWSTNKYQAYDWELNALGGFASGGLKVACSPRKLKVMNSIPAGVGRFSGRENRRRTCYMLR
ncbi:hypothetical protein TNCV_4582731 [Trichonephila clavipes]|nr:hypothetical protein TNCV_4582731 [Trichonephila clavipes]